MFSRIAWRMGSKVLRGRPHVEGPSLSEPTGKKCAMPLGSSEGFMAFPKDLGILMTSDVMLSYT